MIDMEGTHDNDDEEMTFISLAALTANVTRYLKLDEQEQKPGNNTPDPKENAGKSVNHDRAFVERRLRELSDWERRIREDRLRYKHRKRT
jgi:hypothetical protein